MSTSVARVQTIVNGIFHSNCFVVWEPGGHCIIMDPGDEASLIISMVQELELTPEMIVATHAHVESIGAAAELRTHYKVPFALHAGEQGNLEALAASARLYGLPAVRRPGVDIWMEDGRTIAVGRAMLRVVHTPGHSPGSVCFQGDQALFTGDTIFSGGYGRSDLPGGDEGALLRSVQERIFPLDDTTIVYPGHGPSTTIGEEKRTNWITSRLDGPPVVK